MALRLLSIIQAGGILVAVMCLYIKKAEQWFYPFLFSNCVLATVSSISLIACQGLVVQERRKPEYLDEAFEYLEQPQLDQEQTQHSNQEVSGDLDWGTQLHRNYAFAANRLREVIQYWRSRENSQDIEATGTSGNDRWQPYISRLRKSLNERKGLVVVMAQAVKDTPLGATKYVNTHALCQNFIYMHQDISRFWNKAGSWRERSNFEGRRCRTPRGESW